MQVTMPSEMEGNKSSNVKGLKNVIQTKVRPESPWTVIG